MEPAGENRNRQKECLNANEEFYSRDFIRGWRIGFRSAFIRLVISFKFDLTMFFFDPVGLVLRDRRSAPGSGYDRSPPEFTAMRPSFHNKRQSQAEFHNSRD
jgi:hypothetical protein